MSAGEAVVVPRDVARKERFCALKTIRHSPHCSQHRFAEYNKFLLRVKQAFVDLADVCGDDAARQMWEALHDQASHDNDNAPASHVCNTHA
jgi:hypothetical protein